MMLMLQNVGIQYTIAQGMWAEAWSVSRVALYSNKKSLLDVE